MIEPTLALQTAIRQHLINLPAVTALVPAAYVRAGSTRPDKLPAVIIGDGQTENLGRAAGGQFCARVSLQLHVWALESGLDTAKTIGATLADALRDAPAGIGFQFDEWQHTRTVWPRDPDPKFGHGVVSLEAVMRWKL